VRSRLGRVAVAACVALALLSLLLPSAPGYDALAWLVWGREIAGLELDTRAGPAWKPLPVALTTAFTIVGETASPLWLAVARAGGLLAVLAAFRLAARLAGPPAGTPAGVAAAVGLTLTAGFVAAVAVGSSEGLLVALLLFAVDRHLDGKRGQAFLLAVASSLLRPEVWPFLACYAAFVWHAEPRRRPVIVAAVLALPLVWFLPDLWGSGDLLRSAGRARIPNPGAPALAERPALEVVRRFADLPTVAPAVAGFAVLALADERARRAKLALAAGGAAWIGLVALLSEAGYSGEDRYLLPAAAVAVILAGVGVGRLVEVLPRASGRVAALACALLIAAPVPFAAPRALELADRLRYAAELHEGLGEAVDRAGGERPLLACGRPFAGRYRFPAVAWHLGVEISRLSLHPRVPGVVFRSRLTRGATPQPAVPAAFRRVARSRTWEVFAACPMPTGRDQRPPAEL
jgi:hypothetical protein